MMRPKPARGHMPFKGHRTMAEVIEDEERKVPSFEDQLRAVAEGRVGIAANLKIPSRDYTFTLGGVSA